MPRARKKAIVPAFGGERVGTKKSDRRWRTPDGEEWASRFEAKVYYALKEQGVNVRRCTSADSMSYTDSVKLGRCSKCGSSEVVTDRSYTPDLCVYPDGAGGEAIDRCYFIEAKGYLRADRRRLLRSFAKTGPPIDLRLLFEADIKVGKGRITDWCRSYLKKPCAVWNGKLPGEWK